MVVARQNLFFTLGLTTATLFACAGPETTAPKIEEPVSAVVGSSPVALAKAAAPERPFKSCLEREGDAKIFRSGTAFRASVHLNKSAETFTFDARHCQFIGETANRVGTVYLQSFTCSVGDVVLTDGFSPLDQEPTLRIRRGTDVLVELNRCVSANGEPMIRSATSAEDFSLGESSTLEVTSNSNALPLKIGNFDENGLENFQSATDNPPRLPLYLRCRSMYGVSRLTIIDDICYGQAKLSSGSLVTFEAHTCRVSHKIVAKANRDFCECVIGDMRMTNEPTVSDERDSIVLTSGGHTLGEFGRCGRSDTEATE